VLTLSTQHFDSLPRPFVRRSDDGHGALHRGQGISQLVPQGREERFPVVILLSQFSGLPRELFLARLEFGGPF
jgi:hypothetical protein